MKLCVIALLFLYVRGNNLGFFEKTISVYGHTTLNAPDLV